MLGITKTSTPMLTEHKNKLVNMKNLKSLPIITLPLRKK